MNWYIVIGRIPFDEEDTAFIIQGSSLDEVEETYKHLMLERSVLEMAEPSEYEGGKAVIYINYIFNCGQHKPETVYERY